MSNDDLVHCECCGLRFAGGLDELPYCGPCGRRRGMRPPMPVEDIDQRFFDRTQTECGGRCAPEPYSDYDRAKKEVDAMFPNGIPRVRSRGYEEIR